MYPSFGLNNILVRTLLAALLVFGTYNPTGRSYVHWVLDGAQLWPLKLFVGMLIVAAFWIVIAISWMAMGRVGTAMMSVLVITFLGVLWMLGLLPFTVWSVQMTLLLGLALLLAIGLSFSGLKHRLSRQVQSNSLNTPTTI